MIPREHGAYGQLLAPMITALALGRPGVTALALASAMTCAFLAHEPVLVITGRRGARAAREQAGEARRWLAIIGIPAIACAVVAIVAMDAASRRSLIAPLLGAAALAGMIAVEREHTAGGEVLSAIVLASIAWPIGLASGATSLGAATVAIVFAAGFVAATMCVHGVIARTRRPPAGGARIAGAATTACVVAGLVVLSRIGVVSTIAPWAVSPMGLAGLALVAVPPAARHLRVVGWTLVASTILTGVWLTAALR